MTSRADGSVDTLEAICFLHWSTHPDPNEVQRFADAIIATRRTVGRPLVVIGLVPADAEIPTKETREALHRLAPIVDVASDAQYVVFHGSSVRARIVRAFLVAIGIAMRSALDIVPDVDKALELTAARIGVDPVVLMASARARGIID